jgi:hypothetical protein
VASAQEEIYEFFLSTVKLWPPEAVLAEFKNLFIANSDTINPNLVSCLYRIVLTHQEQEYRNTLKRCCYILINNWELHRRSKTTQQLIQQFYDPLLHKPTISPIIQTLREWLSNFLKSADFEELKFFVTRHENSSSSHWASRYTPYLLAPQYTNLANPPEQREAAKNLARQLKQKFKVDLALYTAFSETAVAAKRDLPNPTGLGEEVLRIIKKIVAKRGLSNQANLAKLFLRQTETLKYKAFKRSIVEYLIFSIADFKTASLVKSLLSKKLETLYHKHDSKVINDALLLRTANRLVEYLTTEDRTTPSLLFLELTKQGNPLTLVMLLLKILMICPKVRTHLELCVAALIRHFENEPETNCQRVILFFELFNIITTIYSGNIEYNLVQMNQYPKQNAPNPDLNSYRIFTQHKDESSSQTALQAIELKTTRLV